MITLLTGTKGSGKTKKLIDLVNAAVERSQGNVVVIEKGLKLTYDIPHAARLVDSDAYGIKGAEAFVGFVSGICAGNYDVTDVFIDSTLKITGTDASVMETVVPALEKLGASNDVNFCLSVSADNESIPASVAQYIAK